MCISFYHFLFYVDYSGHVKDSNKKDCVLIIDQETGEITIERLASQVIIINYLLN